ncbi:MAG: hypothetical protein Roseis2KO_30280 [Roseivirga sp.]
MIVTVDTFDREALLNSTEYKASLYTAIEGEAQRVSGLLNPDFETYAMNVTMEEVRKELNKLVGISTDQATVDIVAGTINGNLVQAYQQARNHYANSFAEYLKYFDGKSDFNRSLALSQMEVGDFKKEEFVDQLNTSLALLGLGAIQIEGIKIHLRSVVAEKTEAIVSTYGESIGDDIMASLITKAPEKYWNKYKETVDITVAGSREKTTNVKARYNKTKVKAFMGNADIAIKMEDPGNFVVKGVRLDADEAIKASFKVLNQGIKYLAASSGMTIPGESDGAGGNVSVPEINENKALEKELEILESTSDVSIKTLLSTIFAQQLILADTARSSEHAQALTVIQKSFEIYKIQINTLTKKDEQDDL